MRKMMGAALAMALLLAGCGGSGGSSTTTVNSPACVQASKVAGQGFQLLGDALQTAAKYPPLIEQAARAGAAQDATRITAIADEEKRITAQITAINGRFSQLNASFNPAPGSCA